MTLLFDPLDSSDVAHDELAQRRESGYDVAALQAEFEATAIDDTERLDGIIARLEHTTRMPGWAYEEPETLDDILESLPTSPLEPAPPAAELADRLHGAWLGRIAGCNLGKPIEEGDVWTAARIREYLELAGAWPLDDYIPALDPMPEGFAFRDNWVETTRGRVDGSARDDDVDYPILGLHLLETHGRDLTTRDVANGWLFLLPVFQTYTAERAAYINLLTPSVPFERTSRERNPYREWIGALIRGDVFGWTHPGDPIGAMRLAYQDAALSHTENGVYGETWAAALLAGALVSDTVREAFERSLAFVPPRSRLAHTLDYVKRMHADGLSWDAALARIQRAYGHYSWVHTINNAAIIAAGLLWGDDDYAATVGLTVSGGWDTDSNGATAGSVAGAVLGAAALPARFVEPLHDTTRSALFGFDHSRISDLAARTGVLIEQWR